MDATLPADPGLRHQTSCDFSAALDFALSADEIFEVYNNAPCGYHSLDADGLFLRINNTALRWLGYTRDAVVGVLRFSDLVAPESRETYRENRARFRRTGILRDAEFRLMRKDGTRLEVLLSETVVGGEHVASRASMFDITERKQTEVVLRERQRFVDRVLTATPGVVYVMDALTRRNIFASRETPALLGYTPSEIALMGESLFERIIHPDDMQRVDAHIKTILDSADDVVCEMEYRLRRADGAYHHFSSRDTVFARDPETGRVTQYLGIAHDLSTLHISRHDIEEQGTRLNNSTLRLALQQNRLGETNRHLQQLAAMDVLTGLCNRRAFQDRLADVFTRAREHGGTLSLVLLDVDYFKQYNDAFGHLAGDSVLRQVAAALLGATPPDAICARYGGEEFAVILPDTDEDAALEWGEGARRAVEALPDTNRAITASIGVATLRRDTALPASLIGDADRAMYKAKREGRNAVRHAADTLTPPFPPRTPPKFG